MLAVFVKRIRIGTVLCQLHFELELFRLHLRLLRTKVTASGGLLYGTIVGLL